MSLKKLFRGSAVALVVVAVMLSTGMPAFAGACYSQSETTAEQALRIHSELLVVAVSCADAFRRPDLFNDYVRFTNKNARDLAGYERVIGASINSRVNFDHWRTMIANSVAARAAMMDTREYCRRHVGTLQRALGFKSFSENAVQAMLINVPEAREHLSRPACATNERIASRID